MAGYNDSVKSANVITGILSNATLQGDSAYEVAVKNGFVGTEAEWLASLKGDQGDQGIQGPIGPTGPTGATGNGISSIDMGSSGWMSIHTTDGTDYSFYVKGDKGNKGDTGVGISTVLLNSDYTLTITLTDGDTYTTDPIRGAKGETGTSITNVTLNSNYTLTITMSDGTSYTTGSIRGAKGDKGDTGSKGDKGTSISSVTKTGTSGLVDTYTITYDDNTTSTFTVTNGQNATVEVTSDTDSDYRLTFTDVNGSIETPNLIPEASRFAELTDIRVGADGTVYPSAGDAVRGQVGDLKADFNQITELTRNLNTAQMGRYGNASDGKIYQRSNNYYGMASFIPVIATEKYTISYNDILSNNDLSITILYVNNNDEVVLRSGYTATNPRVITVPENATKMNVHFYSTSEVSVSSSSYVQIERGEVKTQYIKPVSAIDDVLREEIKQTPIKYMSAIGAMLDIALGYLKVSYNNEIVDLTHESGKGLFFTDIKNDNDKFAIQCSEFATALYKGVAWDQSRYCVSQNSIAKWGYTTDGIEQTEQDGVPYALSYYDYINNPSLHQTSDIVSKDYMIASEMFRYALNHGWTYEITDIRKQVRPGDFVFYVDSNDIPEKVGKYKGITHVAFAIDVGYDNNKLTILESNNYYLPSKDDDIGIGIGVVNITDYKYGARLPVNESESEYTIIADTILNITGEATDWDSVQIYTDIIQEAENIYTVELNCELENLNYLRIGVRYNEGIKWYVPMINGNVASIVFYANEDFQYIYAGIYNNQTYTLKKMSLYKGYAPR